MKKDISPHTNREAHRKYIAKKRAADPEWAERRREQVRQLRKGGHYDVARRDREPEKLQARNLTRTKRYLRTACVVCSDPQTELHHPDYSVPYIVIPLCKPCHHEVHRRERHEVSYA